MCAGAPTVQACQTPWVLVQMARSCHHMVTATATKSVSQGQTSQLSELHSSCSQQGWALAQPFCPLSLCLKNSSVTFLNAPLLHNELPSTHVCPGHCNSVRRAHGQRKIPDGGRKRGTPLCINVNSVAARESVSMQRGLFSWPLRGLTRPGNDGDVSRSPHKHQCTGIYMVNYN